MNFDIFKSIFSKKKYINTEDIEPIVDVNGKDSLVDEVVSSIIIIVNSKDIGYNIFMELSSRLKDLNNGTDYSQLINIFDTALKKLDDEWAEQAMISERIYNEENWPDIAHSLVWRILENKEEGVTSIDWTMKDFYGESKNENFQAYHMDSETWEILKLYIDDSKENEDGYNYKCVLDPVIAEITYPYCNCELVSSTDTVEGNHIDSNCDTWGTSYGNRAKGLYAFYITDLKKFAIVYESYWVS